MVFKSIFFEGVEKKYKCLYENAHTNMNLAINILYPMVKTNVISNNVTFFKTTPL